MRSSKDEIRPQRHLSGRYEESSRIRCCAIHTPDTNLVLGSDDDRGADELNAERLAPHERRVGTGGELGVRW